MKATFIKEIRTEVKDMPVYTPTHRETEIVSLFNTKLNPTANPIKKNDYEYFGSVLLNPETKQPEVFYVRANEQGLFNSLIQVSNAFITNEVLKNDEKLLEEFKKSKEKALEKQKVDIKNLSWWKRLFKQF